MLQISNIRFMPEAPLRLRQTCIPRIATQRDAHSENRMYEHSCNFHKFTIALNRPDHGNPNRP